MQHHPPAQPAERRHLPRGWKLQIVDLFRKFAAALRQHHARRIQPISSLRKGTNGRLKLSFLGELHSAGSTLRKMSFNCVAFLFVHLVRNIKDQQRRDFAADLVRVARAHRSTPNSFRNLRVARKSEFFTVSSLVPKAAPIARSFKPW